VKAKLVTKKPMKRKVCTSHIIGRLIFRNGQLFVRAKPAL
jgi:hypothetical protein